MRSRLPLPVLVTVLLVLSSAENAFAATELAYDDGGPEAGAAAVAGLYKAVRFSLPYGWRSARLIKARFYKVVVFPMTNVKVHILGSNGVTELSTPFTFDIAAPGWNDASLSVSVSEDFYIAVESLTDLDPQIGYDISSPDSRSHTGTPGNWLSFIPLRDLMIRAVIESTSVGGVVLPASNLTVLASHVAMIGFVAVTATFYIRKRRCSIS